jgi:hypothetical protein
MFWVIRVDFIVSRHVLGIRASRPLYRTGLQSTLRQRRLLLEAKQKGKEEYHRPGDAAVTYVCSLGYGDGRGAPIT